MSSFKDDNLTILQNFFSENYRADNSLKQKPAYPTLLVAGLGRSGTTLMHQVLCNTGLFGWIDNVTARFPQTPEMGLRLSLFLQEISEKQCVSYSSKFGRTQSIHDPHEFGYFWNRWFAKVSEDDFDELSKDEIESVDRFGLLGSIASMEAIVQKPMIFKNSWFFLNSADLAELIPNSIIIHMQRDPIFIIASHLKARKEVKGDNEEWWSVRPRGYTSLSSLPPLEQIVNQVLYSLLKIEKAKKSILDKKTITVSYKNLCEAPHSVVRQILKKCKIKEDDKTFINVPNFFVENNRWELDCDLKGQILALINETVAHPTEFLLSSYSEVEIRNFANDYILID